MPELKTEAKLLKRLTEMAKAAPSAVQIDKQRISFIMGSISENNGISRQEVTKILAAHNGQQSAQ